MHFMHNAFRAVADRPLGSLPAIVGMSRLAVDRDVKFLAGVQEDFARDLHAMRGDWRSARLVRGIADCL